MGPPSSALHPQNVPNNSHPDGMMLSEGPQDNGISSTGSSGPLQPHSVTSIVTTGPDGAQLDEASQQSTISNASAGKLLFAD